jgi:hypothetical protein
MERTRKKDKTDDHDIGPNRGAIAGAARRGLHRRGPHLGHHATPTIRNSSVQSARVLERITRLAREREAYKGDAKAEHEWARGKLYKTIGRTALISENLEDRSGIESTVEVINPISRRQHRREELKRSLIVRKSVPRIFRRMAPGLAPMTAFTLADYAVPSDVPDYTNESLLPHEALFEKQREARGWVLPFVRQGNVTPRRRPFSPSRHRPNDLVIEVPERGQGRIKSWMGGVEPVDGGPRVGYRGQTIHGKTSIVPDSPRIIGVGGEGKGTYFSPQGFGGVSTGFHEDHALEDITAFGNPEDADGQIAKLLHYTDRMTDVQDRVLNRIAEEQGVDQLPERETPRPAHLPPPAY